MLRPTQTPEYLKLQEERHASEVAYVIRTCFPDSDKAKRYFLQCEEHRPLLQVERLKEDTREAWRQHAKALNNQRRAA